MSPRIVSRSQEKLSLGIATFSGDCSMQSGPTAPQLDREGLFTYQEPCSTPLGVGQLHGLANPTAAGGA